MNGQHDTRPEGSQSAAAPQGFQMFKEHIAAMKRGSRLLGGEREKIDERSISDFQEE